MNSLYVIEVLQSFRRQIGGEERDREEEQRDGGKWSYTYIPRYIMFTIRSFFDVTVFVIIFTFSISINLFFVINPSIIHHITFTIEAPAKLKFSQNCLIGIYVQVA